MRHEIHGKDSFMIVNTSSMPSSVLVIKDMEGQGNVSLKQGESYSFDSIQARTDLRISARTRIEGWSGG